MRIAPALTLVVLLLTGCAAAPPAETSAPPTPEPSASPVFASQEEAVAAAEDVYGRYVKIADQIFVDGGEHPERLEAVATGGYLRALLHGFARVRAEGQHSTGGTRFRDFSLQSYRPNGTTGILTAYVCEDISKVDVFDDQGDSVVSPTRPDTTIFQVAFDLGTDGNLRLSSREVWSNTKC